MRNNITIHGQWMYPTTAPARMIAIRARLVQLDEFHLSEFALANITDAVDHAAANAGPFRLTILNPQQ